MDLPRWQADTKRIQWAQNTDQFRDIITVLNNERGRALAAPIGMTENRLLGRAEGYEMALNVIRQLATHEPATPPSQEKPEYKSQMDDGTELSEQPFNNY